jgi:hypothetical protein
MARTESCIFNHYWYYAGLCSLQIVLLKIALANSEYGVLGA